MNYNTYNDKLTRSILVSVLVIIMLAWASVGWTSTYYMRADGTAGNFTQATGPVTDPSACINASQSNTVEGSLTDGDVVVASSRGGVLTDIYWFTGGGFNSTGLTVRGEDEYIPNFEGDPGGGIYIEYGQQGVEKLYLQDLNITNSSGGGSENGLSIDGDGDDLAYIENVNISNIATNNCYRPLDLNGGHYKNSVLHDCSNNGIIADDVSNFSYENLEIYHADNNDGIALHDGSFGQTGNVIDNCYIHNIGGENCIDIQYIAYDTIIKNCDLSTAFDYIIIASSKNTTIKQNEIHNTTRPIFVKNDNISIKSNVFYEMRDDDYPESQSPAGAVFTYFNSDLRDIDIINNTFVADGEDAARPMFAFDTNSSSLFKNNIIDPDGYSGSMYDFSDEDISLHELNNNIFKSLTKISTNSSGTTKDYTSLSDWQSGTGNDVNSQVADPLFISVTNQNFKLQSNSPCIGAGAVTNIHNQTDPVLDYTGNPVLWGPSIGAYEHFDRNVYLDASTNGTGTRTNPASPGNYTGLLAGNSTYSPDLFLKGDLGNVDLSGLEGPANPVYEIKTWPRKEATITGFTGKGENGTLIMWPEGGKHTGYTKPMVR